MTSQLVSFIVLVAVAMVSFCQSTNGQEVLPRTAPQYVTFAKCNYVVFGEFDYNQAVQACATRRAMLGFFFSKSEDHAVRSSINWDQVPGYFNDNIWHGMLWMGARRNARSPTGFAWENPIAQGLPVTIASWIDVPKVLQMRDQMRSRTSGGNSMDPRAHAMMFMHQMGVANGMDQMLVPTSQTPTGTGDCLIIRKEGWMPMNCSGDFDGAKRPVGAMCTVGVTVPSNDSNFATSSSNYCGTYLLPPNANVVQFPTIIEKKYFLIKGSFTFDEATKACIDNKSLLATQRSMGEYEYVTSNLDFNRVSGSRAWLGLKRAAPGSDVFLWTDANIVNINTVPFLPNEPRDGADCVSYDRGADGRMGWKTAPCSDRRSAICEDFKLL